MDWNFTLRVIATAAEGFFLPYGLLAAIGIVTFVAICARFHDSRRRDPKLRCADDLEVARRRAEERRQDLRHR